MMGLAEIVAANMSGTRRARALQKVPLEITEAQRALLATGKLDAVSFPYLADYVPRGWHIATDESGNELPAMFVDTTGHGTAGEPALTQSALAKEIAADPIGRYGYASIEFGPMQGYVARFQRDEYSPRAGHRVEYVSGPLERLRGKLGRVLSTRRHGDRASVLFDIDAPNAVTSEGRAALAVECFPSSLRRVYRRR